MYSNPPMDYAYHTPSSHYQWSIPPTYSTPTPTPSFPSFPWELFTPYYTHGSSSPKFYLNHGYSPHTPISYPPPPNSYSSSHYPFYYNNHHQPLQPTKTYHTFKKDFEKHLQVSHPCFKKRSKNTSQKFQFRNSNSDVERSQFHNILEHEVGNRGSGEPQRHSTLPTEQTKEPPTKKKKKTSKQCVAELKTLGNELLSPASNINNLQSSSTSFVSTEPENLHIPEAILYTTITPLALSAKESLNSDNQGQYSVYRNEISLDTPQVEFVHSTTQEEFSLDAAGEAGDKDTLLEPMTLALEKSIQPRPSPLPEPSDSLTVLQKALEVWDLQVIPLDSPVAEPAQVDPELENAFICHLQDHWFCIRKVNGEWYNFDSLYAAPQHLSKFYLAAYLDSLKGSGWSIFLVRGNFPKEFPISSAEASNGFGQWLLPKYAERITKSCNSVQQAPQQERVEERQLMRSLELPKQQVADEPVLYECSLIGFDLKKLISIFANLLLHVFRVFDPGPCHPRHYRVGYGLTLTEDTVNTTNSIYGNIEVAVYMEAFEMSPKAFSAFCRVGFLLVHQKKWSEAFLGGIVVGVPFSVQRLDTEAFVTIIVGKAFQIFNCAKLLLVVVGPQLPKKIGTLDSYRDYTLTACGNNIGVFKRACQVATWTSHNAKVKSLLLFEEYIVSLDAEGGILLGPSAIGRNKRFLEIFFPERSLTVLETVANIGLELDMRSIRRTCTKALCITLVGISVSFVLGIGTSVFLRMMISKDVNPAALLVFMGVSLSITAFPVLTRILAELKLLTTDVGRMARSAGVVNDVAAWILLILAICSFGIKHFPSCFPVGPTLWCGFYRLSNTEECCFGAYVIAAIDQEISDSMDLNSVSVIGSTSTNSEASFS